MKSTTILVLCAAAAAALGLVLLAVLSPARGMAEPDGGPGGARDRDALGSAASVPLNAAGTELSAPAREPADPAGRAVGTRVEAEPDGSAAPAPEPGPLVGFVVDFEGADGVPGVIVQLACSEAKLTEECLTDLGGRFETQADFPPLRMTARVLDPEGGGVVGTFAWSWDTERGVMRGVQRSKSGVLRLPVAIGPTFVFDVTPRELRREQLRARVVESWTAGALSGVLVRRSTDPDYRLRTTPSAPGTRVGSAFFPSRRGPGRPGRSVVRSSEQLKSWGDRPVRGEGPCWIRYGRGREPMGFGYTPYLEVRVRTAGTWDRIPVRTVRGVHPGVLSARPTRKGDLTGTLFDEQMLPVVNAVVGVLADSEPRFNGWATTSRSGQFVFSNAPAGEYELVITREHFTPAERRVELSARDGTTPGRIRLPASNARVGASGTVWCPHGETVLLELVPEQDGAERRRLLLDSKLGEESDGGTLTAFQFADVPQGAFQIFLHPVSPRAGAHIGLGHRVLSQAPTASLQLRCSQGLDAVEHTLQVVPAEDLPSNVRFAPRAAFGPIGPMRRDNMNVGPGNTVQLGPFPTGSPFHVLAWSGGFRPVLLGPGDFEAGETPKLARVARAELRPGWGARLYFLDATSLLPDGLGRGQAKKLRKRFRDRFSEAVLTARPLAGVRVFAGGRELARSDAEGVAWLVADSQPLSLELFLPGWRASQLDRSWTGGPLQKDLIWMLPD